jgi:hypothetical protein
MEYWSIGVLEFSCRSQELQNGWSSWSLVRMCFSLVLCGPQGLESIAQASARKR